jgi:hypothetical protein
MLNIQFMPSLIVGKIANNHFKKVAKVLDVEATMTTPNNVVLVDEHEIIRNETHFYFDVVGEAASGENVFMLAPALIHDTILWDSIEITRKLKQINPCSQAPILPPNLDDGYLACPGYWSGLMIAGAMILKETMVTGYVSKIS